ncbi:cation transporter [Luteolibacter yonseiensis]|uniref:Cation transporter n=1 Tax=Luteolibacter yonseiensis TaxID=1144680 RepID=A0A934R7L9_9BACT|nr:heavy-metal-associated domain-containing protein [Luteolibacter yonseiensis]MBK1816930.1 cation transporter [Luteolibacter yonseiensis]
MAITTKRSLTGMTCGNCAAKVEKRLAAHPEIESATVTIQPPQATLSSTRELGTGELNTWLAPLEKYRFVEEAAAAPPASVLPAPSATTYKPLLILLGYLLSVPAGVLVAAGGWDTMLAMRWFMGGFFIAFSFFKMLDLRGFSDAYRSYDLVAKAWPGYGFVYPFVELGLGLSYIANLNPWMVNLVTAVVMAVSLAGVLQAVFSKRAIRCACLGTVFQLPMSTVTIIEDGLMLGMAVVMLAMV